MNLCKLNEKGEKRWNKKLGEKAKIQHTLEFRDVIKKSYKNCEAHYFFDKDCLYPFFLVKSRIFGNHLISIPFLDTGGFLGKIKSEKIKEIIGRTNNKIKFIEVRVNNFLEDFKETKKELEKSGFKASFSKQQFIVKISSKEEMWKKFHKHTRNDIRKAKKSGLELKIIDHSEKLKEFYQLYSKEMRNFGTPQHSYKFFKNIFELMENKFFGLNCYFKNKLIASIILLYNGKYGYIAFNVSDKKYKAFRSNDLLYWEIMKYSIKKGLGHLDLGQVDKNARRGTHAWGLYKFKNKWLGKLYDRIYFYYYLNKDKKYSEKKESLKKFRILWKKLPSPLIKLVGPKITRELGT